MSEWWPQSDLTENKQHTIITDSSALYEATSFTSIAHSTLTYVHTTLRGLGRKGGHTSLCLHAPYENTT